MDEDSSERMSNPQENNDDFFKQRRKYSRRISLAAPNGFCRQQSVQGIKSHQELEEEPSSTKLIKTKKDLLVVISMAMLFFMGMCAFSVIAPFFTIEVKCSFLCTDILFFVKQ